MAKIVIIGAGFAGLSAGIYARRNGYETTIYEMHYLPGGLCTAWRRKGFTFEGCLHYVQLVGSSPAHTSYRLWKELGVVPGTSMIHHEVFHTFRDRSGRTLNMYTDADRLEEELLSLSPSDAKEIEALCKAVKRCSWFVPFVQVSLGVNRDLSGTPHAVKVQMAGPFEIAGRAREELWYQHFAFDPTMAPPGKTAVTVLYPSELAWWEQLGYASEEYRAEKDKILDTTIAQMEGVLPGISSQIETSDVATPLTTFRYTNNWKAALGFIMTKTLAAEMTRRPQYALPGLDGFYMIGQWVKGFGVPMAASSGKEVIQAICSAEGSAFRAE